MNIIRKHLSEVSEGMTLLDIGQVEAAVRAFRSIRQVGGTVYLMGNGGSHSTAGHFANDLMKMGRVRAVCLGDMAASMLAYGNDNGWENMYLDQLGGMLEDWRDGVVGITCSGESVNVVRALGLAVARNVITIGLTGSALDSGINKMGLDVLIHAPYPDIRVQEDVHLMVCHAIVRELQREM